MKKCILTFLAACCVLGLSAASFKSAVTNTSLNCKVSEASKPLTDAKGKYMTIVYLENLSCEKIGQNSLSEDVQALLDEGYRVIEVDYSGHEKACSPFINADIILINDALNKGSFAGASNCSAYRSYVLFEGYRLKRDVAYYKDDPSIYNWPGGYTEGDSLYMDIAYPANPSKAVPSIISFSYSNSWYGNAHQRLFLGYTLAMFDDTFLQGAPAVGMAWAIADHPKYCDWGQGKPEGGANKDLGSFEVNPDASRKVKSAIRCLRAEAAALGMSDNIGIYGFSRGSTAASLAIGDKKVNDFERAGLNQKLSSDVQVAALGPGVFDYTLVYDEGTDGDGNLETRCAKVWGELASNKMQWKYQGATFTMATAATAPVIFFYNNSDESYYSYQSKKLQALLTTLGVDFETVTDYGSGHSVPQDTASLGKMYRFFQKYLIEKEPVDELHTPKQASQRPFELQAISAGTAGIVCRFVLPQAAKCSLKLYDLSGRCVCGRDCSLGAGAQEVTLGLASPLPQGLCYVLALDVDGRSSVCTLKL